MKKILAMLLCVALVAALGVSAFADAKTDLSDKVAGTLAGVGVYTKTVDEQTLYDYINTDVSSIAPTVATEEAKSAKAAASAATKEYNFATNELAAANAYVGLLKDQEVAKAAVSALEKDPEATKEQIAAAKADLAVAEAAVTAAAAKYDIDFAKDDAREKVSEITVTYDAEKKEFTVTGVDAFETRQTEAYETKVVADAVLDTLNVAYNQAKAVADRARAVRQIVTNAKLDENSTVFDYAKVDAAVGQAIADYRLADAKSWLDGEKTYLGDAQKAVKAAIGDVVAIAQANAKVQKTNFEANVYNNVAAAYATASANMIAEAGANIAAALSEAAAYTAWIGAPDTAMNASIDSWFGVSFGE